MTFKTLAIVYKMLKENVSDLEQEGAEVYESMQKMEGFYETAEITGNEEGARTAAEDMETMNKEYEKIMKELKEKKEALRDIENAELV